MLNPGGAIFHAGRRAALTAVLMALAGVARAASPATPAAPAASPPSISEPSIPGVCLISQQALYARSKVGMAASARLEQLQQQAQASLLATRKSIEAAAKALEAQRATLPEAQVTQKERALNQRAQSLQTAAAQRSQQLEATHAAVLQRIGEAARPAIMAAYQAHGCGVLFDRAAVVAGGDGLDITAPVIDALDAKVTALSFDLERSTAPSGN